MSATIGMFTIEDALGMFNRDLAYLVDQTHLFRAVCRRAGIPRHANAPERSCRGGPPG
jgi:hypothetical protein